MDNVQIIVYPNSDRYRPAEQGESLRPTDDSAIAHIAFSYRDLDTAFARMKQQGAEIVSPIQPDPLHGLDSFYVRATDGILVELVAAKPIPEGIWE